MCDCVHTCGCCGGGGVIAYVYNVFELNDVYQAGLGLKVFKFKLTIPILMPMVGLGEE